MKNEEFVRLRDAVDGARKELAPFRKELEAALRAYAGPHYGSNGGGTRPVNMLQMAVEGLLQQLSSQAPQVLCRTHKDDLRAHATEMQLALNEALRRMNFDREHRLWVLSAIFSVGILEVGLRVTDRPMIDDEELPLTELFVEAISFDDFVYDTTAKKWDPRQVSFWGHKFTMNLDDAKNTAAFEKNARAALQPLEKVSESAAIAGGEKKPRGIADVVELWQIYIPRMNKIVVFAQDATDPLQEIDWAGPPNGPYHLMGFNPVLNNVLPLPPIAGWLDLDELENLLWRKLGNQASRQKTIGITDSANVPDGQNIIKTGDGDVIAVGNPAAFKEASFGGVNQQTLGFALSVKNMADFVMGNLSAQMGLSPTAETLGQEQMIRQAANVRIASMQGTLLAATERVLRDIAYWLHQHPMIDYGITHQIPGTDIAVPVTWPFRDDGFGNEIDVRKGSPLDLAISIVPYSMTAVPPGSRASLLRQLWVQDILPSVQLGLQPNVFAYMNNLAELLDLPELREIVPDSTLEAPPQQQQAGATSTIGKPNGQYTRNNVSRGQTPQAADQQMAQMLMAAEGDQ